MIRKLFQSQAEKVRKEFWSLNQDRLSRIFFYLLILFLPTQLGKHFWPKFSFVFGLRLDYLSPTIYFTDILVFLILVFSFRKLKQELSKINKKYFVLYLIFIASLSLGLIKSTNPIAGIYGIFKIFEFSLLALYISVAFKSMNKKILFAAFGISVFFESMLSIFQYLNNSSLNGIFYFIGERLYNAQTPGIANASVDGELFLRPYATFSHPNVLAGFLLMYALYLLSINLTIKKNKTTALIILTSLVSLCLSLSRTVMLFSLASSFYLFGLSIFEKFKKGKSNVALLAGLMLLIFLFVLFFLLKDSEVFQRITNINFADESFTNRSYLLSQALDMFIKNPIFGVGLNSFYNNIDLKTLTKVLLIQPVHNIFLLVLAETGIVGFIFFITTFYKGILNVIRNAGKEKRYLILISTSIIFIGFFDHYLLTVQQGQLLTALFLGISFSYKKI